MFQIGGIKMNIKIELVVENSKRIYRFGEVTEITIGREDDNILSPLVNEISRHHAKIFFKDGSWMVQDLESMNGTFRNGNKIGNDAVAISTGDKLRFGSIEAVVIFENASNVLPQDVAVKPTEDKKVSAISEIKPLSAVKEVPAAVGNVDDIPEISQDEIADIPELKPVEASEPPKNDSPISPITPAKPEIKKPVIGGAALKPGLKLPPKPAMGAGLKIPSKPTLGAGLKMPPKPGLVKPGLKLPPKPGLKLPTSTGDGSK
jgi:pSer/pThr/pTyr-binding forkhead associated (FHA) protein